MNKHEYLYNFKNQFEERIKTHNIFKLSFEDAAYVTLEKVAVLYELIIFTENEKMIQTLLRNYVDTNSIHIDFVSFLQESLKWMFRFYSKFCSENSSINLSEIKAEDIYHLMGEMYSYEKFYFYWDLFNGNKTTYIKNKNQILFNFYNEEVYKIHVMYENYHRKNLNYHKAKSITIKKDKSNFQDAMNYIHLQDFNIDFEVDFDNFNFNEFKIFSMFLNKLTLLKLNKALKKEHTIIIPGKSGLIIHSKQEWIKIISNECNLDSSKSEKIIDFFTYNKNNFKSDISLSFFIPLKNNNLILSESIFQLSLPQANALRLLKTKHKKNYDRAQNNFENLQIKEIQNTLSKNYLIAQKLDKSLNNRPGMDLLVYDYKNSHLQIIELKYKIPIESTNDIKNLDSSLLNKAYSQLDKSKEIVSKNLDTILQEYFGEEFINIKPKKIDYFILTNYSIGTGIDFQINLKLPTPILLIDHYLFLMNQHEGMKIVTTVLKDKSKGLKFKINKRYATYKLCNVKFKIPEFYSNAPY